LPTNSLGTITPDQAKALKSRYRRIIRFAGLALAQTWWFELVLPKFGLSKLVAKGRIKRIKKLARKFHTLAADLGGLMIKVGQFLSTRLDVLPEEVTNELVGLQDEVAPEPIERIVAQIERELGLRLDKAFSSFEATPLAAASLGQAHRATLSAGIAADLGYQDVIVKVLRPGIEQIVEVDLQALRRVGRWLSKVKLVSKRADAPALVEEFAATSLEEIDYVHEAVNLERFAENFDGDERVFTPEIIWERSGQRVLTLSDVTAIKINDIDGLLAANLDPNAVAAELARITFEQIFIHGFFHADPHPGNIFVRPGVDGSEVPFSLVFIDFGMMGTVDESLRSKLQRFIFAIVAKDARAYLSSIEDLGILLPSADTVELERAVTELFDRFAGVGVAELTQTDPREIREFALRFSEIVRTLPFQLPGNFLLLIRTVSLISGVTSALNREFNMWDAVDPFARTLLNGGASSAAKTFGRSALSVGASLARLPRHLDELLSRANRGELTIRNPELERRIRVLDGSIRRVTSAIIFVGLLVAGILLGQNDSNLGTALIAVSSVPLIHALGFWRIR
jgi:predicted unusual protein kinase regulating ubiquinone biosynthesis (AarF/ABC1/UbiB family)